MKIISYENVKNDYINDIEYMPNLKYTLGISNNGKRQYHVIGENGVEEMRFYHYEIGSITKIFTGLLVAKAVNCGKISLEATIDQYIPQLKSHSNMPTIKNLLTHRSGFEYNPSSEDSEDYLPKENPFIHITKDDVIDEIIAQQLENREYPYCYSNLGAAALGIVLEEVYNKKYICLLNDLLGEIGLSNTYTTNPVYDIEGLRPSGDLDGHWEWKETSAYAAAGCLVSTAEDMLKFGEFLLEQNKTYAKLASAILAEADMGGYIQGIGYLMFNYPDYSMYFHDGGTGCFNSTLCVQYDKRIVSISLSNAYHEKVSHTFRLTRMLSESQGQPIIETKRLRLRQINSNDAKAIYDIRSNKSNWEFFSDEEYKDIKDAIDFINEVTDEIEKQNMCFWMICGKTTSKCLGTIGLWNFSKEENHAETGYEIAEDERGNGYAYEALEAVVEYAGKVHSLQTIRAITHEEHASSITILQKAGFKDCGLIKTIEPETDEDEGMKLFTKRITTEPK